MKKRWLITICFLSILLIIFFLTWYFLTSTPKEKEQTEEITISATDAKQLAKDALLNILKTDDYALYLEGQEERYEFYAKDSDGNILAKCEIDKQTGEAYIYDYTSVGSGGFMPGKTE